ncbi:hypothetical protein ABZX62_20305 [Streptomyces flavidovirens]|uniref:hypothetical protein n=1 Tax=Streptomyces flavidovirens TaxID=67298 RepID=UPI0033AF5C25
MVDTPYVLPDDYESDPEYLAILARLERPWWKRPVGVVTITVALSAAAFFIGASLGASGDNSDAPSRPPQQQQSRDDQPAGLTYQQKQQILHKFCNSSQMRGPVGDSSAFPLCMGDHYVTEQGMVMPR